MSAARELKAETRDQVGKGAARAVRRGGRVPAIIYGGGESPRAISLDANETRHLILAGHFRTTVFNLEVGGTASRVIPRDYQLDPVKDTPLHVDFLRLKAGATIDVDVPVHFEGQDASPGLKRGGTLNIALHAIGLVVQADAIPDALVVSLSGLDIGDAVHASDLVLPAGAKLGSADDSELVIATIAAPSALGKDVEEETAAIAEAASADAAAVKVEPASE